jgi:hypothetical protein
MKSRQASLHCSGLVNKQKALSMMQLQVMQSLAMSSHTRSMP